MGCRRGAPFSRAPSRRSLGPGWRRLCPGRGEGSDPQRRSAGASGAGKDGVAENWPLATDRLMSPFRR